MPDPTNPTNCPRCGRSLRYKRDGIFRWKVCPATVACGWTVFTHGRDPRDKAGSEPAAVTP